MTKKTLFSIALVLFISLILLGNTNSEKGTTKAVEIVNWEETDYRGFVNLKLQSKDMEPYIVVFGENNMAYMENGEGSCNVLSIFDDPAKQYESIGYLEGEKIKGDTIEYSVSEDGESSFEIVVNSRSMENGLLFFLTKQKNTGEDIGSFIVIMNNGEGSAEVLKALVFKHSNDLDDYDLFPIFFCKAEKLNPWDYAASEDGTLSDEARMAAYGRAPSSSIFESIGLTSPNKSFTNYSNLTFTTVNQGFLFYSDSLYLGDETEENLIKQDYRIKLFTDNHCYFGTSHSIDTSDLEKGRPNIVLKYNFYIPMY